MTCLGMNPLLKDWIQVGSWAVAIIGGLIAAFVAIYQLRANRRQREIELRWNQAKLGRELFDQLFDTSGEALLMLDYYEDDRVFAKLPGKDKTVSKTDILTAVAVENRSREPKIIYVRERLDALFYHFERFENSIENKLVTFDDVKCPSEYYAAILAKQKEAYDAYLNECGYKRAKCFLDRFPQWRTPNTGIHPAADTLPSHVNQSRGTAGDAER